MKLCQKEQPFFGSQILPFPLLDRDFTGAYATWVNARLDAGRRFRGADVHEAFHLLGRRPEFLRDTLQGIVFGGGEPGDLGRLLLDHARDMRASIWAERLRPGRTWHDLTEVVGKCVALASRLRKVKGHDPADHRSRGTTAENGPDPGALCDLKNISRISKSANAGASALCPKQS